MRLEEITLCCGRTYYKPTSFDTTVFKFVKINSEWKGLYWVHPLIQFLLTKVASLVTHVYLDYLKETDVKYYAKLKALCVITSEHTCIRETKLWKFCRDSGEATSVKPVVRLWNGWNRFLSTVKLRVSDASLATTDLAPKPTQSIYFVRRASYHL